METRYSQLYVQIYALTIPINIYINGPFGNLHAH